jgi:hypothetical protein
LVASLVAGADDLAWKKTVADARSELFRLVAAEVTAEDVAQRLRVPWPLSNAQITADELEKLIDAEVLAKVDAKTPMPDDEEIRKRAAENFAPWKVGDEVDFRDQRGRRIKGRIRAIYPGSLKIGFMNVSKVDIPLKERAHLSKELAEKEVRSAIFVEQQKVRQEREKLRRELEDEVREELSKTYGFVRLNDEWVAPREVKRRVLYTRKRQIAWGMRQRERDFMTQKGFARWDREWIPADVRDKLIAALKVAQKEEQDALTQFASLNETVSQRDIQDDMVNLVLFHITMIDGSEGAGSGFVLKNGFRKYVVTNQHLFVGAKSFTMRTAKGVPLRPKTIAFAKKLDLAEVTFRCSSASAEPPGLELSLVEPKMRDAVLVLGNSQGAGVVTSEPGAVSGLGPDLVEVTAKFVPGNSGSPILNAAGKVVGVATFATRDAPEWVTRDSRYVKVRRFGMRLRWDAYPEFAFLDWSEFVTDSYLLKDLDYYVLDLYSMAVKEVERVSEYRMTGNLAKYRDSSWGTRAIAIMGKFENMWAATNRYDRAQFIKIVEEADRTFRSEVGLVRETLAARRWKTDMMLEQAKYLDTACEILQDIYKNAAAKAIHQLRR